MTNDVPFESQAPSAEEARQALDSVAEMRAAAVRRGVPPRWLGGMIAVLIALFFAALVSDQDTQTVTGIWIVIFSLTIAVKRRTLVLLARNMRLKMSPLLLAGQLTAVVLLVGVFVATRWFAVRYGFAGTSLAGGTAAGLVFYGLFEFKRHMIRRSIEAEFAA